MASSSSGSSAETELLLALAREFVDQGNYAQAVRALQPVCALHELPATAARARVALARLLLLHFHNPKVAKAHLMRAVSAAALGAG